MSSQGEWHAFVREADQKLVRLAKAPTLEQLDEVLRKDLGSVPNDVTFYWEPGEPPTDPYALIELADGGGSITRHHLRRLEEAYEDVKLQLKEATRPLVLPTTGGPYSVSDVNLIEQQRNKPYERLRATVAERDAFKAEAGRLRDNIQQLRRAIEACRGAGVQVDLMDGVTVVNTRAMLAEEEVERRKAPTTNEKQTWLLFAELYMAMQSAEDALAGDDTGKRAMAYLYVKSIREKVEKSAKVAGMTLPPRPPWPGEKEGAR